MMAIQVIEDSVAENLEGVRLRGQIGGWRIKVSSEFSTRVNQLISKALRAIREERAACNGSTQGPWITGLAS